MSDRNILLIWDRAGPYHIARAQALRRRFDGVVVVAELGASDALYQWCPPKARGMRGLSPKSVESADFMRRLWRFARLVRREHIHDVAVAGYAHPTYWAILLLSRFLGLRIVLFAESWYPRGRLHDLVKGWALRILCDAVFVSGQRALDHFRTRLKFPSERLQAGYSVVHNQHFRPRNGRRRGRCFLCVARFAEPKNLLFLVEAFRAARLPLDRKLLLVGGGPLEETLRKVNDPRIQIRGWVPYATLPALYAEAEWLVLPSLFEPWGLVVNEAMAAGAPVIASTACGCVPDLLTPETGLLFDPASPEELVGRLERAAGLPDAAWLTMSNRCMDTVASLNPDSWARALMSALQSRTK